LELSWSTFLLEILNFLVLVWILKRFLYRPVAAILEKRRENIDQKLNEATKLRAEAVELEQQYQGRLGDWELEKQHAHESLQLEIQAEQKKLLEQLEKELSSEREKAAAIEQRHQTETLKHLQQNAHAQGAQFAAKLLNAMADAELESRLFDLLITTFDELNEEHLTTLSNACKTSADNIVVTSAFPLSNTQHQQLEQKLSTLCQQSISINYIQDTSLLAGLRICIGAWMLCINLQDELRGFAELSNDNPII